MPVIDKGLKEQKFESPSKRVFFCSRRRRFEKSHPCWRKPPDPTLFAAAQYKACDKRRPPAFGAFRSRRQDDRL